MYVKDNIVPMLTNKLYKGILQLSFIVEWLSNNF